MSCRAKKSNIRTRFHTASAQSCRSPLELDVAVALLLPVIRFICERRTPQITQLNRAACHRAFCDRDVDLTRRNAVTDDVMRQPTLLDGGLQCCLGDTPAPIHHQINLFNVRLVTGVCRSQRDGAPIDGMDLLRGVHNSAAVQKALVDWGADRRRNELRQLRIRQ